MTSPMARDASVAATLVPGSLGEGEGDDQRFLRKPQKKLRFLGEARRGLYFANKQRSIDAMWGLAEVYVSPKAQTPPCSPRLIPLAAEVLL